MATEISTDETLLPAAADFVSQVRALFAKGLEEAEIWERACGYLRDLLADDELHRHAATWPDSLSVEGRPGNLLFYEDPDYDFVINGLIKNPGGLAVPHDHGKAWTVYGVLAGHERIVQ